MYNTYFITNVDKYDSNKIVFIFKEVDILLPRSRWKNLARSELTEEEKKYFIEKIKDGMCETANGHTCYVGRSLLICF